MADWLHAFQIGASTANAAQDRKLRQQAFASQQADRQIRERELAARISQIDLENQKLTADIAQRAESDAQWLNVNTEFAKRKTAIDAAREAGMQGPELDPLRLAAETAAEVAPLHPKTMELNQKYNAIQSAQALAEQRRTSDLEADALRALAEQRRASAELSTTRKDEVGRPRAGVAPELQRLVEWIESRKGEKLSDEELTQLFEVQQGLKPRAAVTQPNISEPNFIARELPKLRAAEVAGELNPKKRRSDDQLREELRRQYREIYKSEPAAQPAASAPAPTPRRISVKDASGKIVGTIPDTPTQRKLANDKGLILVE